VANQPPAMMPAHSVRMSSLMYVREARVHHGAVTLAGKTSVLILVKAAPQPSRRYGDTVCVAGLEGGLENPRWIRLYPVPFRYLDGDRQFHKYQIIKVITRDAGSDKRPESRKINAESIELGRQLKPWSPRAEWVERVEGPTMCGMLAAVRQDMNGPSLGAIRPAEAEGLVFERHPGWTPEQLQRFEDYRNQGDLFTEVPPRMLEAPKFVVSLRYRCEALACGGHEQRIIDWELNAVQFRFRNLPDDELRAIIIERFFRIPFAERKSPLIFVGNQEKPERRASFTVLGLYYPAHAEAEKGRTLF
jgi:hypothetical protein